MAYIGDGSLNGHFPEGGVFIRDEHLKLGDCFLTGFKMGLTGFKLGSLCGVWSAKVDLSWGLLSKFGAPILGLNWMDSDWNVRSCSSSLEQCQYLKY